MRRHGRKSKTMKTQKLKACPFCGSEANQPEDVSVPKYGPWWQVMCSNEQCRAWRPGASPAKAARVWNTRAGDRQPATPAEAKGIVPFASASGSEATDKRLMAAVTGLMQIVEGVRNARWAHEGKRLVDTPEWCELYCAWNAAKAKPLNEKGQR